MTTFITLLFILGSLVMAVRIYFGMLDVDLLPFSCPKCYDGGDDSMLGAHRPWYHRDNNGIVYCRTCHTVFREHPNGSLVEDRPTADQ